MAEVKFTEVVEAVLQTVKLVGKTTSAEGLTVIEKLNVEPIQLTPPFVKVGVTSIVATEGIKPVLVAVNDEMFPTPLAPNPIAVLLFVQA